MIDFHEVLETVRAEKLVNRREMLDLWDLKHQEEDLEHRRLPPPTEGERRGPEQGETGPILDGPEAHACACSEVAAGSARSGRGRLRSGWLA